MSTVRPTRTGAIGIVVVAVIGAIAVYLRTQWKGDDPTSTLIVGIGAVAASSLFAIVFFRNRRIEFEPDLIRVTSLFGARREISVAGIDQIVIAPKIETVIGSDLQAFSVMDVAGEPFARLNLTYWDLDALSAATSQYGDKVVVLTEPMPKRLFVIAYPRALSYGMLHPYRSALLIAGATIAAALGFAAFTDNLG